MSSSLVRKIESILINGEEILLTVQQAAILTSMAPDAVVITNRRLILVKPTVLGGMQMNDFLWIDLQDARLTEGMLYSTLSFESSDGKRMKLDNLPKVGAREAYRRAQELEEHARRRRRALDLEERRASAVNLSGMPHSPYEIDPAPTLDTAYPPSSQRPPARAQRLDSPNLPPAQQQKSFPAPDSSGASIEDRLRQLKAIHNEGLIDDADYERKRNAILDEL